MNLAGIRDDMRSLGFPRMRGDEPRETGARMYLRTFSPHARG